MPKKSLKKTFNFHLRKKRSSQENEEKSSEQDSESILSEPIASRLHARNAKIRCIKSLSTIIRDEKRLGSRERARARVANESEEQRKQRLKTMRGLASKRLASESPERRQKRLHDLRRRAAQRIERERRREQKRRAALRLSYLPTYKSAVSPDVPYVSLERIKLYNKVGVSTSKQQQQSELTNTTHKDDSGSWERNSPLRDDGEDDDSNTEHEFEIICKVEPYLHDEWELDGEGDRQAANVLRNWYQSDKMANYEENNCRSREVDKSVSVEAEIDDIEDDIDIKEEPLDENFNNIVLERTVLMMCRDN